MISVANKTFKTKKELECFTRNFLKSNLGSEIVIGQYGSKFLSELVNRHPDRKSKVRGKINRFIIHKNFGGHVALSFIDEEGEKSIGWRKCISQTSNTWLANLREVCRKEVTNQVQDYKDENYYDGMPCPSCNTKIETRKQAHVDHKTKSFKDIFSEFTGSNFVNLPTDFKSAGNHLSYIFKDEDWFIKDSWVEYHRENADYQILCASCNMRKG